MDERVTGKVCRSEPWPENVGSTGSAAPRQVGALAGRKEGEKRKRGKKRRKKKEKGKKGGEKKKRKIKKKEKKVTGKTICIAVKPSLVSLLNVSLTWKLLDFCMPNTLKK